MREPAFTEFLHMAIMALLSLVVLIDHWMDRPVRGAGMGMAIRIGIDDSVYFVK
jgi:hypothetical protein